MVCHRCCGSAPFSGPATPLIWFSSPRFLAPSHCFLAGSFASRKRRAGGSPPVPALPVSPSRSLVSPLAAFLVSPSPLCSPSLPVAHPPSCLPNLPGSLTPLPFTPHTVNFRCFQTLGLLLNCLQPLSRHPSEKHYAMKIRSPTRISSLSPSCSSQGSPLA